MVRGNRRAATAAVLLGFFVVMLDITVVNVALGGMLVTAAGLRSVFWINLPVTAAAAALVAAAARDPA